MRTSALLVLVFLSGCPKKEEARKETTAEVEFFGSWKPASVRAAKTLFVAIKEPCLPVPAEVHSFGKIELGPEKLFAEFWPPQGTVAHLCAFGLDEAGRVVSAAAYAKNPVTLQGEGEVVVSGVELALEALAQPAAAPRGL